MEKKVLLFLIAVFLFSYAFVGEDPSAIPQKNAIGASAYWQQHVDYKMEINMDVKTYTYTGKQELQYTNNSPDTLTSVYYHLYFNAFQPGSEMDVRSRTIPDPDPRVADRISKLNDNEIGYLKVQSLEQDGVALKYKTEGTILEVMLNKPVPPGASTAFNMQFNGQVPVQIRRSGRNSKEGVALSMSQWYPKMAEYDFEGWHTDPYIGREFHGVWGNFDVKITIDKKYVLGGTGYLQNPQEIGHGYEDAAKPLKRPRGKKLTWHFYAPKVHDFTWAADPDYIHDKLQVENGPMLHFFYKNNPDIIDNWKKLQPKTAEMMQFFSRNIGKYPYKQYSVIQGGDGGMEYAMCTLITGGRDFGPLASVTSHEMAHSWFQQILASNEAKHAWMDEGFASFVSTLCMNKVMKRNKENPFENIYKGYIFNVKLEDEQPQTTHADRYTYNRSYGISAYNKGEIFLSQLAYVIGQENLMKALRKYYNDFKFKHPTPNDFKRTAEKVSGIHLDWYLTDWTKTTNTIDYGIKEVAAAGNKTKVTLQRIGVMPMPLDVLIIYNDGRRETIYIPLRMMRGEKKNPYSGFKRTLLPDWAWAYPDYEFSIDSPESSIQGIVIDPSQLMADIERTNNVYKAE